MPNLIEAKYEDIFSPETLQALKGRSGESLQQLMGDKDLMQAMRRSKELLDQIAEAERGHEAELVKVAIDIVRQVYPIIDYNEIKIEASLGGDFTLEPPQQDDEEEEEGGEPGLAPNVDPEKKRRFSYTGSLKNNAVLSGFPGEFAIRDTFSFHNVKNLQGDVDFSGSLG